MQKPTILEIVFSSIISFLVVFVLVFAVMGCKSSDVRVAETNTTHLSCNENLVDFTCDHSEVSCFFLTRPMTTNDAPVTYTLTEQARDVNGTFIHPARYRGSVKECVK